MRILFFEMPSIKDTKLEILGPLEEEIMEYVWSNDQAAVRDVWMVIKKNRKIAYTTVMTVMDRLYKKKMLKRKHKKNAYIYRAAVDKETFTRETTASVVESLLLQFGDAAIAQFIDVLDELDHQKLERLQNELNKYTARSQQTVSDSSSEGGVEGVEQVEQQSKDSTDVTAPL